MKLQPPQQIFICVPATAASAIGKPAALPITSLFTRSKVHALT